MIVVITLNSLCSPYADHCVHATQCQGYLNYLLSLTHPKGPKEPLRHAADYRICPSVIRSQAYLPKSREIQTRFDSSRRIGLVGCLHTSEKNYQTSTSLFFLFDMIQLRNPTNSANLCALRALFPHMRALLGTSCQALGRRISTSTRELQGLFFPL